MATVSSKQKTTPLMEQYFALKAKYKDAILLFRVGDFYETFGEDAIKTSKALGIVLTNRNNGTSKIELAGFPHHALDTYLPRLIKAGYRVAICEQLEKPSPNKKLVKRGITEVVTPGITFSEQLLEHRSNNFLASLYLHPNGKTIGIAFVDVSTGEFLVSEGDRLYIEKLLKSFQPSEVLYAKTDRDHIQHWLKDQFFYYGLDPWIYTTDYAREKLLQQFQVHSLKGFGIEEMKAAQIAAGAAIEYLDQTQNKGLRHINRIQRIDAQEYMWLDQFSIRNLELIHSQHPSGKSLLDIMDCCITPMGSRTLKRWLLMPLIDLTALRQRHDIVDYLIHNPEIYQVLDEKLRRIGDLERLCARIPQQRLSPRDAMQLKRSLDAIVPIKESLLRCGHTALQHYADQLHTCDELRQRIQAQLIDDPPPNTNKANFTRSGFDDELDRLRHLIRHSKETLQSILQREIQRTGIQNLKIGFNNVFGYYFEVTNKFKNRVPSHWVRKQTLTQAERYISDELKQLEETILGAEEKILQLEESLFHQLLELLQDYIDIIQQNARTLATLDCLRCFAEIATKYKYTRPEMDSSFVIDIKGGRHPVIERTLPPSEPFIPNDVYLDRDHQQILMITGPNMSGKSALLRQTALIVIMAQIGCFVPAESARIGIVDKIFTRVGASDNISSGESTFMVEMNETASIMHNITDRSLVLLDEIGRGTSTYDGISIAWAIAEYLHDNPHAKPKTLFATHYHELNALADQHPRIKNFNVAVKESNGKIIFLRKLKPGGSNHSFGIHVAKLAGMPPEIVLRAREILQQLESAHLPHPSHTDQNTPSGSIRNYMQRDIQLQLFQAADPIGEKLKNALRELDPNTMTPIECMLKLVELRKLLQDDHETP